MDDQSAAQRYADRLKEIRRLSNLIFEYVQVHGPGVKWAEVLWWFADEDRHLMSEAYLNMIETNTLVLGPDLSLWVNYE